MRVFAGPNGSGKSTVIDAVRNYKTDRGKIDFGIYINADDIAKTLKSAPLNFDSYKIKTTAVEFADIAFASGLINKKFTRTHFFSSFNLANNKLTLLKPEFVEQLAQIIADFLRKKLLKARKKFSFETVFSHPSKLDIMRDAKKAGYKVYLYFVSTNSPDINIGRVALRVAKGGHDVPKDRIVSRYARSLDQLYDAAQLTYQTFFWDNSDDQPRLFTQFKKVNNKKIWTKIKPADAPDWFITSYADKVAKKKSK